MTQQTRAARYPSRTVVVWRASWAAGAPSYPGFLIRGPEMSLPDYMAAFRAWNEDNDRWRAWYRDQRAKLPSGDEIGEWREHRCAWCAALLADTHPPTRDPGVISPDLGLRGYGFPRELPFAILVPGLTRELDAGGKPRRDAAGRPYFGPPRRGRYRRGRSPSSDGLPQPFVRHSNGPVLIHCPGCGRVNELVEPRWGG